LGGSSTFGEELRKDGLGEDGLGEEEFCFHFGSASSQHIQTEFLLIFFFPKSL
jgi:hypothetical protein